MGDHSLFLRRMRGIDVSETGGVDVLVAPDRSIVTVCRNYEPRRIRPPGFDTSPRFSPLFGKCLQRRRGFEGRDRRSAVVARL